MKKILIITIVFINLSCNISEKQKMVDENEMLEIEETQDGRVFRKKEKVLGE